jgi:predicted nucleic acid-binding protein
VRRWRVCRFRITCSAKIRQLAERPPLDELRAPLERRSGIIPSIALAEAVRAERDNAIVVNASALLEALLCTPAARRVEERLFDSRQTLHARICPISKLRKCSADNAANGELDDERGRSALADLADFPLRRYPHDLLLPRVWELRSNLTAYELSMSPTLSPSAGLPPEANQRVGWRMGRPSN